MSRERYEELLKKEGASPSGVASFSQEERNEFFRLVEEYQEKPKDKDTAGFFKAIQKTAQNLFASGSAGIETIGEATGIDTLDRLGERGQAFVEPSLDKGPRLKTFDDIQDVGDSVDWLFNSALPQISTSIALTIPSIAGGAAAGSVIPGIGTVGGAIIGAFLPSMILGTGEITREIRARKPFDEEGKPFSAPGTAIRGGIIMGALDTLSMAVGLRGLAPKLFKNSAMFRENVDKVVAEAVERGVRPSVVKTAISHAMYGAIAEGSVEVLQEQVADWEAENATDIASPEGELSGRLFETFVIGGLGGTGFGTIGGLTEGNILQKNYDAQIETDQVNQRAEQRANVELTDLKIDDMDERQFGLHLLKNNLNNTRYLPLIAEGKLNEAKKLYKQEYISNAQQDDLTLYAQNMLPEVTLGSKQREMEAQIKQSYTQQQINDAYDKLRVDILTEGRARGLSDYQIRQPETNVTRDEKISAIAKQFVQNEYIELADVGIGGANRLLSNPALYDKFKRESEQKTTVELLEEHKQLYPTGVGTEAATQEQARNRLPRAVLIGQVAEKRFKLANSYQTMQEGKEETFSAPLVPTEGAKEEAAVSAQLQNIWVNEIGRGKDRLVDPLSGKVTRFGIQYLKNDEDTAPITFNFKKTFNTQNLDSGEVVPTRAEYVVEDVKGSNTPESYIGKTFDDVAKELLSERETFLEPRLSPMQGKVYGGRFQLLNYTGKRNENLTERKNPIDFLLHWTKYGLKPRGSQKSEGFFELERRRIARLRSINQTMLQLAHAYDTAVVDAVVKSNGELTYDEINRRGTDFLTNTQREYTVPDDYRNQLLTDLSKMRNETSFTTDMYEEARKRLSAKDKAVGPKVNILDLPENVRAPLFAMRANIDSLNQRLLDELPKGILAEEIMVKELTPDLAGGVQTRPVEMTLEKLMQRRLGQYVTDQYKLFDIKGFNPFSFYNKMFGTKRTNELKQNAVNALLKDNSFRLDMEQQAELNKITVEEQAMIRLENIVAEAKMGRTVTEPSAIGRLSEVVRKEATQQDTSPIGKLLETKGEQMIPELRELFGVYDNPAQLAGITASKIAKIAENYAFFNRLLELDATSGEKIFSPTRNGVYQELIDIPDTPINGFYTTKEMHEALMLNKKREMNMVEAMYRNTFLFAKSLAQAGKTVYSPMAQIRNFVSAGMFYTANGHSFGGSSAEWKKTYQTVMSELGARGVTQTGKITFDGKQAQRVYARLQELGVINTNTVLGELISNLEDANGLGINAMNSSEFLYFLGDKAKANRKKPLSQGSVRGSTLFKGPTRLYQASDDFWKVLSFFAEKNKFEKMFPKNELETLAEYAKKYKGYKTGTNKYEDLIQHIAAYNVRHTIPNYDYVGRAGDFIRKTPFGNFIAFPIEIVRTSINIADIGRREIKAGNEFNKPALKRRGYARIAGYSGMAAGLPFAIATGAKMIMDNDTNEDDEKGITSKQLNELRRLLPEYAKYNLIAPIALKDGKFTYLDLSHMMVYDSVSRVVPAFLYADTFEENFANGMENLFQFMAPFGEPSIFTQAVTDIANNQRNTFRDARGGNITNEVELGERMKDYTFYLVDQLQPGISAQLRNLGAALPETEFSISRYGRKQNFEDALAALSTGMKIAETDIRTTIPFKVNDYIKKDRQLGKIVDIFAQGAKSKSELKQELVRYYRGLHSFQKELFLDFQAGLNAGVEKEFFDDQIKDRAIFATKRKIKKLPKGSFGVNPYSFQYNQLTPERDRFYEGSFIPEEMAESSFKKYDENTERMKRQVNVSPKGRDIDWSEFRQFFIDMNTAKISLLGDWYSQTEELVSNFLSE